WHFVIRNSYFVIRTVCFPEGVTVPYRVAIVRGIDLNPYELQSYEPLAARHDIVAVGSRAATADLRLVSLPVARLASPADWGRRLPRLLPVLDRLIGDRRWLLGLERALAGRDIAHTAET